MKVADEIEQLINLEAIKQLSTEKKREIIDMIEETIEKNDPDDIESYAYETPEELAILEDRMADYLKNPGDVITLEELMDKFRNRPK